MKDFLLPRFKKKKSNGKELTLLANAPSLSEVLPLLTTNDVFKKTDYIVMNYFVETSAFFAIKPSHYCFADPMFFKKTRHYERVKTVFQLLNEKVDWNMNIYVLGSYYNMFRKFSGINNKYLKIIPIKSIRFNGSSSIRNWLYKNGYTSPPVATVANMAIYAGINSGYKTIKLYGVDHTWFDGLCVNKYNEVCRVDKHFYSQAPECKPLLSNDNDRPVRMSQYIQAVANMFYSHDLLSDYAQHESVDIFNCTECSLIDSYARRQ